MIGFLKGGHIFVYDVCADDLWLVRGQANFTQQFEASLNGASTVAETSRKEGDEENIQKSTEDELIGNQTFFKKSLKVKALHFDPKYEMKQTT